MVGTPRSTGCENCRKRKKKCGQEQPECLACVTSGWKCPGFDKRWKFVDESQQVQTRYKNKRYILEEVHSPSAANLNDFQHYQYQNTASNESYGVLNFHLNTFHHLSLENDRTASILKFILTDPQSRVIFPIGTLGSFFEFIPSRLGANLALDTAISTLCTIYIERCLSKDPSFSDATKLYAKSLGTLRSCLEQPVLRSESETICASIILQICELCINADKGRWSQLSKGSKLLIESRGPEKHDTPFDRAMLESQRAFFIIQDVNVENQTFLSNPQWRQFFQNSLPSPVTQEISIHNLRSSFCNHLVEIPALLSEASSLPISNFGNLVSDNHLRNRYRVLILRVTATYRNLELWYIENLKPLVPIIRLEFNELSEPNDHPLDAKAKLGKMMEYTELLLAVLDCVSNSVLIRLQKLLMELVSLWPDKQEELGITFCSAATLATRQTVAIRAHSFVKRTSVVSAKLLEFGLQQLWSSNEFVTLFQRDVI